MRWHPFSLLGHPFAGTPIYWDTGIDIETLHEMTKKAAVGPVTLDFCVLRSLVLVVLVGLEPGHPESEIPVLHKVEASLASLHRLHT